MLVAFASSDGQTIDSHFAAAKTFEVYSLSTETPGIIYGSLATEKSESEDKVEARIKMLQECAIIYCTSIGGPAAARLVQSGIHPMKVPEGTPIVEELCRLDKLLLSQKLPPWLKKKLAAEKQESEGQE